MATIKASLVISAILLFATPVPRARAIQRKFHPAAVAPAPSAPTAGETSPDRPVLQHRNPRYKIQRGDTISIAFPLASEFDQNLDRAARRLRQPARHREPLRTGYDRAGSRRSLQESLFQNSP